MKTRSRFSFRRGCSWCLIFLALGFFVIPLDEANAFDLTIGTGTTSGVSFSSCIYQPTASGAFLSVAALNGVLASPTTCLTGVTVSTASGGAITVAAAVTSSGWTSKNLTVDAGTSIVIGSTGSIQLPATGSAGLILKTNDGGSGGLLTFMSGGSISFGHTNVSGGSSYQSLTIGTQSYVLIASQMDLTGSVTSSCYCALAKGITWTGGSVSSSPITGAFTGVFEGLGNAISGLSISTPSGTASQSVGLFSQLGSGISSPGAISDLNLTDESVTATETDGLQSMTGGLVGLNDGGTLTNDSAGGSVTLNCSGCTTAEKANVGGLVGNNEGTIANSSASAIVSNAAVGSAVGGLVGYNFGNSGTSAIISSSNSSGAVTGAPGGDDYDGGLVGSNVAGTISNSYATGSVTCSFDSIAGGLVGYNAYADSSSPKGLIYSSYTTTGTVGSTSSGSCRSVAGLVGQNASGGVIEPDPSGPTNVAPSAYETVLSPLSAGGLVDLNNGIIKGAYARGNVTGNEVVGGLVAQSTGSSASPASISQSFALGSVTDTIPNGQTFGGLVGEQGDYAEIDNSYSLGAVNTLSTKAGGFIGINDYPSSPATSNITVAYEAGTVYFTAGLPCIGGFAGVNDQNHQTSSSVTSAYWDTQTNTVTNGVGTGLPGTECDQVSTANIQGSAILQSGVPSGLGALLWTYDPTGVINCGYPYLITNVPPSGITCP